MTRWELKLHNDNITIDDFNSYYDYFKYWTELKGLSLCDNVKEPNIINIFIDMIDRSYLINDFRYYKIDKHKILFIFDKEEYILTDDSEVNYDRHIMSIVFDYLKKYKVTIKSKMKVFL